MPSNPTSLGRWLDAWRSDLRFSLRSLRRAPGFSLAVGCTLLVCIGPNTAILSALHALVLKPLPFPDPGSLHIISNVADKNAGQVAQGSMPQYRDFKEHADLFAGFAVIQHQNITLDNEEVPIRIPNDWVSADYFDLLGVKPLLGRFFTPEEETPGRDRVLVLSHDFWQSHYQGDPGVIGRVLHAGGLDYTIVGVAPPSLAVLSKPTCFFQPYAPPPHRLRPEARYSRDCILYARLRPGVALSAGLEQLTALERRFRDEQAGPQLRTFLEAGGYRLAATPLGPGEVVGDMKLLWLLQGGALLVLLIGGVNVVNLFLARLNAKRAELAIRVALGAGQLTLLRQVLMESALLTGAATIAGLGFAAGAIQMFNLYLPLISRMAPPVTLPWSVVAAVIAAAALVSVVIGLLPHLLLWRTGLRLGDNRAATTGSGGRTASSLLVVTQVAVATVLLVGAGLMIRSFAKVLAVDPGFDAARIVQGRIALPPRYREKEANLDVQRRIQAALREIPGVENAAQVGGFVLVPNITGVPFVIRDDPRGAGETPPLAYIYFVSPEYFAAMGMRVLEGRGFTEADDLAKEPVVVVDQTFVERYSADRLVLGRELGPGAGERPANYVWPRVVGVVNRANLRGLEQRDSLPFIFLPTNGGQTPGFNVIVRSARPTADILRDIRTKLRAIDPTLPLYATGSLQEGIDSMLLPRRGIMLLLAVFSGFALLLAAIGLYGVLAYDVTQRTREIGIRGALGATRAQIVSLVLNQSLWKTACGLGAGLLGSWFLTRSLQALLFDITASDPLSYLAVSATLLVVAGLASWLPARRAATVDPIIALRAD
ncbi:ABC transporter permease [Oleiharenicola lentus]|uniref:ABC transporter permease n=1 Tax=Oleiharenicola lentus TaxID=2508720 RepID=A0A4Q1C708_9BACT|nr:ABC transporter permease [Oleiharenicola lentus]RXK54580.1 ABC transporter permease [Oleiharenicola lentus]